MSMKMNLKIAVSFNKEVNALFGESVKVELVNYEDEFYIGVLSGYDLATGSLVLTNVKNSNNEKFTKIILQGNQWSQIFQTKPPFPMEELADKISKIFPTGQVSFRSESNTISILNGKIIVGDNGITHGSGPTADRVYSVYEQFMEDLEE